MPSVLPSDEALARRTGPTSPTPPPGRAGASSLSSNCQEEEKEMI